MLRKSIVAILLVLLVGCNELEVVLNTPPPPETPTVNLPERMRVRNWRSPRNGQGSCVHASTVMLLKWLGEEEMAIKWQRKYSGGETASSILNYWAKSGLPYCSTLDARTYNASGDPAFLKWCSETRRGAIIWWKTSHCCLFCGFVKIDGKEYAIILDNNTPDRFDPPIPIDQFIKEWRGFGGFAATPVLSPTGPIPWPIILPRDHKEI